MYIFFIFIGIDSNTSTPWLV